MQIGNTSINILLNKLSHFVRAEMLLENQLLMDSEMLLLMTPFAAYPVAPTSASLLNNQPFSNSDHNLVLFKLYFDAHPQNSKLCVIKQCDWSSADFVNIVFSLSAV